MECCTLSELVPICEGEGLQAVSVGERRRGMLNLPFPKCITSLKHASHVTCNSPISSVQLDDVLGSCADITICLVRSRGPICSPWPQATSDILSVSINLIFLNISYTSYDLLCLASISIMFLGLSVSSTCQYFSPFYCQRVLNRTERVRFVGPLTS